MGCLLWIVWLGLTPFAFLNWITFFLWLALLLALLTRGDKN